MSFIPTTFIDAQQATELLLGIALIQHSIEHWVVPTKNQSLFAIRALLAALLATSALIELSPRWIELALLVVSLMILSRFRGPYNGGSDRMGYLVLICIGLSRWLPDARWQEIALGYLALQLTLSYAVSGWVKIVNADWRNGMALQDVFRFSAYPVSESLRAWSNRPRLLTMMSWCVMVFEILFPLALLNSLALRVALVIAACFHLANACLFGLNRFVWIWLAAYPSILWFQTRFILG